MYFFTRTFIHSYKLQTNQYSKLRKPSESHAPATSESEQKPESIFNRIQTRKSLKKARKRKASAWHIARSGSHRLRRLEDDDGYARRKAAATSADTHRYRVFQHFARTRARSRKTEREIDFSRIKLAKSPTSRLSLPLYIYTRAPQTRDNLARFRARVGNDFAEIFERRVRTINTLVEEEKKVGDEGISPRVINFLRELARCGDELSGF